MRSLIRSLFHPVVLGGALIFAILMMAVTLAVLYYTRPGPIAPGPATAVLSIIPAATATQPLPTATPTLTPEPTQVVPPSPLPGVIGIGAYVQIAGTGGDGLRLREQPGLESSVRLLGAEAEVFQVQDGPQEKDGYTWWLLVGVYDATRTGWAVANFLEVVQNP